MRHMHHPSKKIRDHPQRRWLLGLAVLVLLWFGTIVGGVAFAHYSGGGNGSCQTTYKCVGYHKEDQCYVTSCGSIRAGACRGPMATSGCAGSTTTSTTTTSTGGGTFCWATPSGGDNATINGQPGYLASCGSGTTTTACTPSGSLVPKFQYCTSACHTGEYQNYNSCGSASGSPHTGYAAGCTSGCASTTPPSSCTPNGTVTEKAEGCTSTAGVGYFQGYNSCHTAVGSKHTGSASWCTGSSTPSSSTPSSSTPAPSCTPSSSTSYGSTDWTGCQAHGVESGTQSYTVNHSCPSYQSSGTRTVTQSTSTTCQSTVRHQCAYAKPGYAQKETCLTDPAGGYTDCSGWSSPYYDPHDCPIPTPVN